MAAKRIGWIGTGVMGQSMAARLLAGGFDVAVHTRTRDKAQPLLDRGARWLDSVADAAGEDAVVSMVGYPADVEEVLLSERGVIAAIDDGSPCRLIIDMTTSTPSLAVEIAEAAAARGVMALDAPVSGGDVGARDGTLSIMVGGDSAALAAAVPIFDLLGKQALLQGGPGAGQHTKMVNQTLIASAIIGVCEGLLYARRAGLDCEQVLASVAGGAAGSWSLSNLGPRILCGDFDPGFFVEHFVKDMEIALEEARRMELELPGLTLARSLYGEVIRRGGARLGTQALYGAIEAIASGGGDDR